MGMAYRNAAGGRLGLRGMLSFEPWMVRGCGYPDLLAPGGVALILATAKQEREWLATAPKNADLAVLLRRQGAAVLRISPRQRS